MTNQDEGFQQRWEMRGGKVGDTSSDDEGSKAKGEATEKKPNTVTDLVLYGNGNDEGIQNQKVDDEKKVDDTNNGIVVSKAVVAADEKKAKPRCRKKKEVQKKLPAVAVKETKKKRKSSINLKAMMKDLKTFGDSLVQELAADREKMFANMREEMRKLAASRPNKGVMNMNVNVRQRMNVASTSNNTVSKAVADAMKLAKELHNTERLRQSVIALPTTFPSSHQHQQQHQLQQQLHQQNQMNRMQMMMNDRHSIPCMNTNNNNSNSEMYNLMAARSLSRRVAEYQQQQQYGGFSIKYHKNWGVYGESQAMQDTGSSNYRPRPSMPSMNGSSIAGFPSTNPLLGMNRNMNLNINMIPSSVRVPPRTSSHGEFLAAARPTPQGQRDNVRFNMTNNSTNS